MAAPKSVGVVNGHDGLNGRDGRDSRPVPDPTALTSQLVDQATTALKDVLMTRIIGLEKNIEQVQADIRARPAAIEMQISHLQALHEQKFLTMSVEFQSVQTQFAERDVRVRDAALANTTAINAALQSQKEAAGESSKSFTLSIDKSEKGTLEQIAQQRVLLDAMKQTMDGKVDDLKERLTRIESVAVGSVAAKSDAGVAHTTGRADNAFVLSMVMGAVGIISLFVTIFVVLGK